MPQSFDPVFGDWYTQKCIGNGTDGRVYTITRKDTDGKTQQAILKTIRLSANRSENKGYNSIGDKTAYGQESMDDIISDITDNIDTIKKADNGKCFVSYKQWEVRDTSDGKGKIILIMLEEMRSLSDLLERFSFTLDETVRLGISVCKALCRCRDFGYIYPNLKPENILFDRKGLCKLGDFGSFSCLEPSKTSVAFKRTQYYMSPEFIRTGKINGTADTYSLGLVLYMLTNRGRLPFCEKWPQEVTVNGLDRSKENRLAAMELEKPECASDALFAIIKKACAFKEEERYLSPRQMLADLKNVLEKKPLAKAEYEDIYSVSAAPVEQEKEEAKEEIPDSFFEPTVYEKPVELRREISIPDVAPSDYAVGRKTTKRRRPASYAPLPKVAPKKRRKNEKNRSLLAIIIAIIFVAVLLITSIALRASSEREEKETTPVAVPAVITLTEVT